MAAHCESHPPAAGNSSGPTELLVSGMTCQGCVRHVTEAIQSVPGVASALVQLEGGRAQVRWKPDAARDEDAVVQAVKAAGYSASVPTQNSKLKTQNSSWSPLAGWRFNVAIGLAVTLPLMLGEWVFRLHHETWYRWTAFALALPVQIFCGARFYRGAWNQLKVGSSNMDTLVALGSTTAFGYSVWALLAEAHAHLYFMEAAAIITLISVGHWVEAIVGAKAASSLRALMNLAPPTARRLDADGREVTTPVAELRKNDHVLLKPGDRVPTDGLVLEGNSAVDETMLTGESLPVEKSAGAKLYTGTVNQNGQLIMRVEATGESTALAQIIAVVQRAQSSRADIQRIGDRVSNVFVPIVVLIALATGLWWGLAPGAAQAATHWLEGWLWSATIPDSALASAFVHAAAVLIIACPCAMGLATPAAIMAGTNAAARRGILIRDGAALEKCGDLTAVVFDKTGTLTQGRVAVAAVEDLRAESERKTPLAELAAALARPSNHPLSQAVAKLSEKFQGAHLADGAVSSGRALTPALSRGERENHPQSNDQPEASSTSDAPMHSRAGAHSDARALSAFPPLPPGEGRGEGGSREDVPTSQPIAFGSPSRSGGPLVGWQEIRGSGVQARALGGRTLRLGSLAWLGESGVELSAAEKFSADWSAQGATLLGLAQDARLLGLLALRDELKPHAAEVVSQLARGGQQCFLITGDNRRTAAAIALAVGIAEKNVFAEIRPEQKADIVKQLQQRGERVAFIGDGINDAPALEQADLGIAVSRASDVAREAADVILLNSDIQSVPETLALARATLRTIKQNLFWAFFYNAAGIPLAALGFMSPVLCAAAMGFSDLIVIGNALRLARSSRLKA
ncbi:MAG: heavy metal translocating P-type ATPase [Verrucomicrobia bacterium]|nr:heavy metal translocating P-type ATPase [Verrucomicrobiota bacterium]